jgi:hypothetical protein
MHNAPLTPDRRRFPRLQMMGEIQGQLVPFENRLTVLDMSIDGFALESPIAFAPHAEYLFQLGPQHGPQLLVSARNIHCVKVDEREEPWFVAGFSFSADVSMAIRQRIATLMQDIQAARWTAGESASAVRAKTDKPAVRPS